MGLGVVKSGVDIYLRCIIIVMSVENRKRSCRCMLGVYSNEFSKQ